MTKNPTLLAKTTEIPHEYKYWSFLWYLFRRKFHL